MRNQGSRGPIAPLKPFALGSQILQVSGASSRSGSFARMLHTKGPHEPLAPLEEQFLDPVHELLKRNR
jgi:hypothetical protein